MNKRKRSARLKHRRRRLRYEVKRQELVTAGVLPAQAVLRRARPSTMAISASKAAEVSDGTAKASVKTRRASSKAAEVSDGDAKASVKTRRASSKAAEVSDGDAKANVKTRRASSKAAEVSDGDAKANVKTGRNSKDSSRSSK
jgi:hypothetical protein